MPTSVLTLKVTPMFDKLFEILQWAVESLIPFAIIYHYQRGVLLRFGHFKKVLEPGLHWCLPLHLDLVLYENVKPRTTHISGLSTTTKDGKSVGFDAIVTWGIVDIEKALLEVNDIQDAITDACAGEIGTRMTEETWDAICSGAAWDKLTTACRRRGKKWGINIEEVQLAGVSLVKNIRLLTSGSHNAPNTMGRN